jgi:hypothetical protein
LLGASTKRPALWSLPSRLRSNAFGKAICPKGTFEKLKVLGPQDLGLELLKLTVPVLSVHAFLVLFVSAFVQFAPQLFTALTF